MPYYKLVNSEHWPNGVFKGATERWWERQSVPYVSALPFRFSSSYVLSASNYNPYNPDGIWYIPPSSVNNYRSQDLYNEAYEKLMSELGNQSSWGTNLAEAEQSCSTVERRLLQLGQFAGALRDRNFFGAAKALKSAIIPPGVSAKKSFADNFLEWHFGWEPAIQDVHDACQTMSKADFGTRRVMGSASRSVSEIYAPSDYPSLRRYVASGSARWKVGAHVRITNDSAYLASQMGLVNPLTVAWDLVPYSFVVDWFANVSQVLGSVTGFVGLTVQLAYNTQVQDVNLQFRGTDPWYNPTTGSTEIYTSSFSQKSFYVERNPGIPGPALALKPFKGFSPVRGLTAASLLLQKL